MIRNCKVCKKTFDVNDNRTSHCSHLCFNKRKRYDITCVCARCEKESVRRPSEATKFCSRTCSSKVSSAIRSKKSRLTKTCTQCSKTFTTRKCDNCTFCSKTCGLRYLASTGLNLKDHPNKYSKAGFRTDLNKFFRSKFEANYARFLKYTGITYKFEPEVFNLGDCYYMPDFYLPKTREYVELKGRPFQIEKVGKFQNKYPNKSLRLIWHNSKEWRDITKKYKKIVPNWE